MIGIRSIGAALGALVAAAVEAPPPVTLRPIGHPFRRALCLSEELVSELLADPAARFAVADEGPGLSGSSFGAVADFLEDRGVAPDRIHFFPSHGGEPGPQASPRHRARWARAHRHVVEFDALALRAPARPAHRLSSWVADLVGPPDGPLEEISGGGWRRLRYAREADWPPVHAQAERRKFLLRAGGKTWLLKFAGLGREGERKLERARVLHAAGVAPAVAGYRHGFLVEEWIGDARSLEQGGQPARARSSPSASGAISGCGRGTSRPGRGRERRLPSSASWRGTTPRKPWARRGRAAWSAGRRDSKASSRGCGGSRPTTGSTPGSGCALPDGRLLKADALDHHAAHDLVGCQDVAWDIAGAVVELELEADVDRLCAAVEREAGRGAVEPGLVSLLTPCYLAFQLGAWTVAAAVAAPDEAARLGAAVERYAGLLRRALDEGR